MKQKLTYIFVHGLSGWGSYDETYKRMPYWGMRGGDLISWLRAQGFSCYAASVAPTGSRDPRDYAGYDMQIDHALALNQKIRTQLGVYYFSVPCSYTGKQKDGTHRPKKNMEPLFVMRSCQIGAYSGRTAGGMVIDESWRENDGLVNTVSAAAPIGTPQKPLDKDNIAPGIWNVFPAYDGDHMAASGRTHTET